MDDVIRMRDAVGTVAERTPQPRPVGNRSVRPTLVDLLF